jgi:Arc/MetJ-type ribon-helix-helix transcriptional regulator
MQASSKRVIPKKRGRPATGNDPVRAFRLSNEFMARVDAWAAEQDDRPSRAEAIRRLVELGLTVKTRSEPSERQRAAIADLASQAIDSLTAGAANTDEKASRKRRLVTGSEEFQSVRRDRPNRK